MRYVNDEASRRLYTEFLSRHERCNFQQSVEWARVKSCWTNEIVLAEDAQGGITGGLSILIRKVPFFGNLMYAPRGPVCDTDDTESLRQLTEGAELLAWKYNAMALRMEPDVTSDDRAFRSALEALGYVVRDGACRPEDVVQPRQVFRLDIRDKSEEELWNGFSAKLRYNIRLAQRRGVTVREGSREDLPLFHGLLEATGRRDRFLVRPLDYFEKMWQELGPEHISLLLAYVGDEPVAGVIPIHYGNKTWYAAGASSDRHRNAMAGYLLQWEAIRRALARGDAVYDLRGVLEKTDISNGLYLFKSRFGGDLTEFIGEVVMAYRPVAYRLFRLAEKLYRPLRDRVITRRRAQVPPARPKPLPHPLPDGGIHGSMTA